MASTTSAHVSWLKLVSHIGVSGYKSVVVRDPVRENHLITYLKALRSLGPVDGDQFAVNG